MGCDTCKQKNNQTTNTKKNKGSNLSPSDLNVSLFEGNSLMNSSFLFKLVTFLILTLAIPFIVIALWVTVFFIVFLPNRENVNKLQSWVTGIFKFLLKRKAVRLERKNRLKFKDKKGYDDPEMVEIEVVERQDNKDENEE